jgi:hypothetical protein
MAEEVLAPEVGGLSQVERVVDTFVAPTKTFTDILRSTSWWLPFLLGAMVSYGLMAGIAQKVGWAQLTDNQIQSSPSSQAQLANATPEQGAKIRSMMTASFKYSFAASPVINILSLLVISLVLWPTINFVFAGKSTFGQVFSVMAYAFLPEAIKALIATAVLYIGTSAENFTADNMLGTSPGYYLSNPGALKVFLTSFDIFTIWAMVLMAIGLAIVGKIKRSSAFIAVFGWWLLIVLIKTGYTAFTS